MSAVAAEVVICGAGIAGVAAACHLAVSQGVRQLGSIQAGALADFVALNGNPRQDIKATRTVHSVWIGGREGVLNGSRLVSKASRVDNF